MDNVIALIPARSGSKSMPDKNIRIMNGKPLIAYSIEAALKSRYIQRVIVSTDSEQYASIAREYGAETPFLRPYEFSRDTSLDIDVFRHYIQWSADRAAYVPEILVHLRPTHPIRKTEDIDHMIEILLQDPSVDSVRSLSPAAQTPYKMWLFSNGEKITPVANCDISEAYNAPRQLLPTVYLQNASIDVLRRTTITQKQSMTGTNIYGYVMNYDFDIDSESDFLRAERFDLLRKALESQGRLKICCDIDGIIAQKTQGNDYALAKPIRENIRLINDLHAKKHIIVLFTARGYATGLNWEDITKKQMQAWGVHYDQLLFGKPDADVYLDDKAFDLEFLRYLIQ